MTWIRTDDGDLFDLDDVSWLVSGAVSAGGENGERFSVTAFMRNGFHPTVAARLDAGQARTLMRHLGMLIGETRPVVGVAELLVEDPFPVLDRVRAHRASMLEASRAQAPDEGPEPTAAVDPRKADGSFGGRSS